VWADRAVPGADLAAGTARYDLALQLPGHPYAVSGADTSLASIPLIAMGGIGRAK
jgi:hypothetical protein